MDSRLPSFRLPAAVAVAVASLALAGDARGQSQSLAFTGGALLNTQVNFRNLGSWPALANPGPATGGAVDRTYDNGYNRVDAGGNPDGTTVHWGYLDAGQIVGNHLVLSAGSTSATASIDDAANFIEPSGNLEYRGSMGGLGSADWGILLGIGYQTIGAEAEGTFAGDARIIDDSFSLLGASPDLLPAAPYSGGPESAGPRIGSVPSRSFRELPGRRLLTGYWELEANVIPITGGLYLETQLVGRLNGIVSAGVLAMFINADLKFSETSTIGTGPAVTTRAGDGTNDFLLGGFAQLGLDWALWENASLVAGARWQPTERFSHSVSGREAEIDFTTAFAVHAGFSMRF